MTVYAAKHVDKNIVEASRSGGVFSALTELIFDNNGVVYGCILDENYNAIHVRASDRETRNKMRGSKYIQSDMGNCFSNVKTDLDGGLTVLFSGTSCQVAGLKSFLRKEYENLLCVDIVCHGVPSPKLWNSYLQWIAKGKVVYNVDFRNKQKYGWRNHVETIDIDGGEVDSEVWKHIFYNGSAFRPCCYECKFKSINHPGDITIGDYWNIEKAAPEFDDNKGVSIVFVNTKTGIKFWAMVQKFLKYKETKIEDSMQRAFLMPENRPEKRGSFWKDYEKKGFCYIAKKYGGLTPKWSRKIYYIKERIKTYYERNI